MKYLYLFFLVLSFLSISCSSSDDSAELTKPDIDGKELIVRKALLSQTYVPTSLVEETYILNQTGRSKRSKNLYQLQNYRT